MGVTARLKKGLAAAFGRDALKQRLYRIDKVLRDQAKILSDVAHTVRSLDEAVAAGRTQMDRQLGSTIRIEQGVEAMLRRADLDRAELAFPQGLVAHGFRLRSQNQEGGVTLALLAEAGLATGRFVEIGCGDNGGNSRILAEELGWSGLTVDAVPRRLETVRATVPGERVQVVEACVTRENVNELVTSAALTGEIDHLSIDIDGNDYWVWQALDACSPRVVIVKYNSMFGPDRAVVVPYDAAFRREVHEGLQGAYYGASLRAFEQLGQRKGYRLVAVEPRGVNAHFLRADVATHVPASDPRADFHMLDQYVDLGARGIDLWREIEDRGLPLVDLESGEQALLDVPHPSRRSDLRPETPPLAMTTREAFHEQARELTELLAVDTQLGLLCMSPLDRGKGKHVFLGGAPSHAELDRALRTLQELGMLPQNGRRLFVDVGAHIGIATLAALRSHGFDAALAVEPEPLNYRILRANLALNELDAVVTTACTAISDAEGEATLALSVGSHGKHKLVDRATERKRKVAGAVAVATTTLDALLARYGWAPQDVGLVKIDTEGHEPRVLAGARELLGARVPIMIEWAPFRMGERLDLAEELVREHYKTFADLRVGKFGEDRLRPTSELSALRQLYAARGTEARLTDLLLLP